MKITLVGSLSTNEQIKKMFEIKEKLEKYIDNPQIKNAIDEIKLGILALDRT